MMGITTKGENRERYHASVEPRPSLFRDPEAYAAWAARADAWAAAQSAQPKAAKPRDAVRVLRGHLTATERRAVRTMVAKGWTEAHTPRIRFELEAGSEEGLWTVTTHRHELNDLGQRVERRSTAQVEVTS